jgi:serine/threonine protein kinase/Flp pilus assembly protein TadD
MAKPHSQEEALFYAALEVDAADQRAAYLDAACGDQRELRRRVEALLRRYAESAGPLDRPVGSPGETMADLPAEQPSAIIGPYKLLEQIGEGGMGTVWMAQQTEPVKRLVAVKLIKAGMDSQQVIARFEAERQALAIMDHPHIAKVFDGGATPSGRPYFVMELVKGVPITDFCDQNHLTPRERLELFLHVCQAVQHAHQKGIIHRDLKPSNVLVSRLDMTPVVKVIDFGVAKALGQELTDKTLFTGFAQLIGTPLYMSPEQAALSGLDVDTRSDIYSLGVLLYELLTGTTPFDKERFREAGYDEIRRILREEEPPRPSTRISTMGPAAATVTAQRRSDPRKLIQLFRGELDWIVMKCLDKDRNRRYETANGLARDIERYLHDEAVLACPPSALYRLRKFVRRNKRVLAPVAAAAAALMIGLVLAVVLLATHAAEMKEEQERTGQEYNRAEKALGQAKGNLLRADQNLTLALEALDDVYMKDVEDRILRDRHMTQAERASLEKGLRFYERFARQNSGHAGLERVTAKAYRRAGSLRLNLLDCKEAEAQFTKAIPVFKKLSGQSGKTADFRQELARCFDLLSEARIRAGSTRKAEPSSRQAVAVWQQLVDDFPKEPSHRVGFAVSLLRLGRVLAMLNVSGGREEAEKLIRRALELYKSLAAKYPGNVVYRAELAWTYHELNYYVLCPGGRRREALANQQQATAFYEGLVADSQSNLSYRQTLGDHYLELGHRLNEAGQVTQAEEAYQQGLRTFENLVAESPSTDYQLRVGLAHSYRGNLFRNTKRLKNAEQAYRKALDVYTKMISDSSSHHSVMWRLPALARDLAQLLQETGRTVEADAVLRQAAAKCVAALRPYDKWPADRNLPGDPWEFVNAYQNLGHVLKESSRFQEAAEAYWRALGLWEKVYSDLHNADLWHWQWLVRIHIDLGRTLTAAGKLAESESAFRKAAEVQQQQATEFGGKPEYRRQLAESHSNAAHQFHAAARFAEEEKFIRLAILLREELAAESPGNFDRRYEVADAYHWLFSPLWNSRRLRAAETANRQARALLEKLAKDFPDVPKCLQAQADCHLHWAWVLAETDRLQKAERALHRSVSLRQKLAAAFPANDSYRWQVADAYSWLGEILKRSGKLAQAIDAWRQALPYYEKQLSAVHNLEPRRYLATRLNQLGDVLMDANRLKEAEESYRKALPIWQGLVADFNQPDYRFNLAENREGLGRVLKTTDRLQEAEQAYREAIAALDKLVEKGNVPDHRTHLAWNYVSRVEVLHRLAKQVENDTRHSEKKGKAQARLLRDRAGKLQHEAEKRGLLTPEALNGLAWPLVVNPPRDPRDAAWAVELAKMAIQRAPDNGPIVNTLGVAYYRTGNWKAAIEALKQAEELSQGQFFSSDAFFIAMAHWQLGDKQLARKWYTAGRRWMEKFANNDEQRRFRAEAAARLGLPKLGSKPRPGNPRDDRELYTRIIELSPEAAWAYLARGQILRRRGEAHKAQEDYRKVLELHTKVLDHKPNSPGRWADRALTYSELGDWTKAASDWQKAAALWEKTAASGASPLVWYHLALARLGAKDQAGYRSTCAEIVKRFAKKDPGPYSDLALWGCVLAAEGASNHSVLLVWAEKLLAAQPNNAIARITLGAALYRAGRFNEAARRLNEAQAALAWTSETSTTIAYPWYFLTMVHQRLGHSREARRWLEKANREAEPGPRIKAAGPARPWNRRLTLQLLRREAGALLNDPAKPKGQ